MNKIHMKKRIGYALIFGGVILVLFVHFYKLTEIPLGLHADEASAAYDAFSISTYGVDRALDSYPFYFTNYGDGQNALYIYLMVILFKLFGISRLTIRIVMAAAACVAAGFGFFYAVRRWQDQRAGIVFLYLYAILPIFIMTQRFGLESHLMLAAAMVSIYLSARALEAEKWYFYFLAGCALGAALYTYALAYIVVPVFLVFLFFYSIRLKKLKLVNVGALALPLICLAIPLILVQLVNLLQLPEFQIGPFTVTRLQHYRSDELAISFASVISNMKILLHNTLFYDDLAYNTLPKYGTMYYLSIPFILLGIGKGIAETGRSIKSRSFHYSVPILAWWLSECIMGSSLAGFSIPNTTRMNGIFMQYLYFLVSGLWTVWEWLKQYWQKIIFGLLIGLAYMICFFNFAGYYFTDYTQDTYPLYLFYEPYEGLREFKEENAESTWVNRTTCYPSNYVYYMLEFRVNPWEINIPANGDPGWGAKFRSDIIWGYPDDILLGANYVVHESDVSMMALLKENGYDKNIAVGKYRFFISPSVSLLEDYVEGRNKQVLGSLDQMFEKEGSVHLTGWWIDDGTDQPFDVIQIKVGEDEFEAEQTERADVAATYGKDQYLRCGYQIRVPKEIFLTADIIVMSGTTQEGEQVTIYEFFRKGRKDNLDN